MKTLRKTEDIVCTCIPQLFVFPNMVLREMKIHEHWTRVTRLNPLWVSDTIQYDFLREYCLFVPPSVICGPCTANSPFQRFCVDRSLMLRRLRCPWLRCFRPYNPFQYITFWDRSLAPWLITSCFWYICVIDQAWGQGGWILAKFFFLRFYEPRRVFVLSEGHEIFRKTNVKNLVVLPAPFLQIKNVPS